MNLLKGKRVFIFFSIFNIAIFTVSMAIDIQVYNVHWLQIVPSNLAELLMFNLGIILGRFLWHERKKA